MVCLAGRNADAVGQSGLSGGAEESPCEKAMRRLSPELACDDEPAGSVQDEFGFMMARTANNTANFLVSLMR